MSATTRRQLACFKKELSNLQSQIDNAVIANGTAMVDVVDTSIGFLAAADIHNNGPVVQFASDNLDPNWARTANVFTYSGPADVIEITVNIAAGDVGVSNYWSRPALRITDSNNAIVGEMDDLAMQQNGAYSGDVQITGTLILKSPLSTEFTFEWFDRENRTSTLFPIPSSHVALKAKRKVQVYTV